MDTFFRIKKMSPQFQVAELERSIKFYTEILRFYIEFRYEDFYVGLVKDGYSIHLKSGVPSPTERNSEHFQEDPGLIFSVDHIDALYEKLSGTDVAFVQPLQEMPYGKEFYISDPDGYIIAFLSEAMIA